MDIEKPLQETSHSMPLIEGSFYMNNLPTRLILYPDSFYFSNEKVQSTYAINFDFTYDIVQQNNGWILNIGCPEGIDFFSPKDLGDWEKVLIKMMKRKKFHEFFKGVKKIGKGNFASVYLTQRLNDKVNFAVKAFQKQSTFKQTNGKEGLENEIKVLRKLNHKNIANLEGVYETDNSIYLVMQLIQGKCLADILQQKKSIPLQRRKRMIKGILLALLEMQTKQIVHRDLKPQNIMIDQNDQPKLVDFGLATETNAPSYLYVRCGTPGYVAPQIISIKDTDHARMHTISDVFSAGAIFYHMIFGRALFDGEKNSQVLEKNRKCFFNVPANSEISQSQELSLLRSMLDTNPDTRATAFQALRMDYFGDGRSPLVQFGDKDNFGRQLPALKNHYPNNGVVSKLEQVRKVQRASNKEN